MPDGRRETEDHRPFGVRLLTLGIQHFGGIHQQRSFSHDQFQPRAWIRGDEVQCPIGPVPGHFGRRQLPPERTFGDLGRILTFVLRRAAAEPQRLIRAVGLRVVPDVEVRAEL